MIRCIPVPSCVACPYMPKPGSLHVLKASTGEKVFEWTGKLWSATRSGWGTKPGAMAVLGWKYVRAESAPPETK